MPLCIISAANAVLVAVGGLFETLKGGSGTSWPHCVADSLEVRSGPSAVEEHGLIVLHYFGAPFSGDQIVGPPSFLCSITS